MTKDLSHLGGSAPVGDPMTFHPDIWERLITKYGIESVLDIGCAAGVNARWFHDKGLYVRGVEGYPEYIACTKLPNNILVEHDYTTGPYVPERDFDMGLCTEFVEHVEAQYTHNFVATFKKCRFILMSFATPGQGGHHHVNEQHEPYWQEKMAEIGYNLDRDETDRMRATGPASHYGRRTLTWFRRA